MWVCACMRVGVLAGWVGGCICGCVWCVEGGGHACGSVGKGGGCTVNNGTL